MTRIGKNKYFNFKIKGNNIEAKPNKRLKKLLRVFSRVVKTVDKLGEIIPKIANDIIEYSVDKIREEVQDLGIFAE